MIDFFGGKKDLQSHIIRVLYNLSFVEDPARIIRAVRFEQRYAFKMDKSTEHFLKKAIGDKLLSKVRKKRIAEEIMLILNENEPTKALKRLEELEALKYILPGIKITKEVEKKLNKAKRNYEFWKKQINDEKVKMWLIYFLCLFKELEIDKIHKLCKKIMLKNKYIQIIDSIYINFNSTLEFLSQRNELLPSSIYIELKDLPNEILFFMIMERKKKIVKERITKFIKEYKRKKLLISGKDIKRIGVKPGPIYSELLKNLLNAQLDGLVKTKKEEIKFVKNILEKKERNLQKINAK